MKNRSGNLRQYTPEEANKSVSVVPLISKALRLSHAHVMRYVLVIAGLQAINGWAVIPGIKVLFGKALASAGLSNVTDRNLHEMLSDPVAVLLLLLIAVIAFAAMGLQFSALIVMANRQQLGLPLTMRGILSDTARSLRRFTTYPSPLLMIYVFLVLPLGGLGLGSMLTQGVSIPPFITREYLKTPLSGSLYASMMGAVVYLNLRLLLTLPMLVIGNKRPVGALVESLRATHRNFWRYAGLVGIPLLSSVLVLSVVVEVLVWISAEANGFLEPAGAALVASICIRAGHVLGFLVIGMVTVLIIQVLVAATGSRLGREALPMQALKPAAQSRVGVLVPRMVAIAAAATLVVAGSVHAAPVMADTAAKAEDTVILAHRGFSGGGVENTIGGLEAAAELKPDYVEADFQETKDRQFVASHDTNLLVMAGVNKNIYDMTADEVTSVMQTGGGFSGRIPTMAEYLIRAKELGAPLLVELKVTGHEAPGYLDRFLKQIDATGTTELNIYHSLNAEVVTEIKERRPELRVGLTVAMSFGELPSVDCDFVVLEQASFNPALLDEAHAQGKPVFVWTVNDEATIRRLLGLGVDGIVTDSVDVALHDRELVASSPRAEYRVGVALAYLDLFR